MEYIVVDEDKIKKYSVNFNKKALLKLKEEIIENCSVIKHRIIQSDYDPFDYKYNESTYKNVRQTPIGEKEYDVETRTIYEYEFDEYIHPNLSLIIDKLVNNDKSAITDLFNYKEKQELTIDDEIKKLNNEIDKIDNLNTNKKIEKLKELKKLYDDKKLNENQQPIDNYLTKVKSLIRLEQIDEIDFDTFLVVSDFLKINYSFDKPIKKTRKK